MSHDELTAFVLRHRLSPEASEELKSIFDDGPRSSLGVAELGKLLCKRGQVEHGAGDVAAAKAALAEAESIAADLGVTAESEIGKLVVELRALLG